MMEGFTTGRLLALIRRFTGNLASLTTPVKTDLVSAVNSLNPQFSSTPVYDVTLAEDTSISLASPIEITDTQLGGEYTDLVIFVVSPQPAETGTVYIYLYLDANETTFGRADFQLTNTDTEGCWNRIDVFEDKGMMRCTRTKSSHSYTSANVYQFPQIKYTPFINGRHITKIKIGNSFVVTIPAGTSITIYAAS